MKILSITEIPCVEITTDDNYGYNLYRRFSNIHWEMKMGGIWCKMISFKYMEDLYQEKLLCGEAKSDWTEREFS